MVHGEVARFRADVKANPALAMACLSERFDVASLATGAQARGYDFSYTDVASLVAGEAKSAGLTEPPKLKIYDDRTGGMRELTEDEVRWVGGAGSATFVEGNAVVITEAFAVVVVAVAAAAVVLALVVLLATEPQALSAG